MPCPHYQIAINAYRPHWRVRKHKTDVWIAGQRQFIHDGNKIIAVCAKAMHPQDGVSRSNPGLKFDGW
jgi:hypothetical protein